jgi:hypothetical protein
MESFEIPCECSATLSVVAGQAGERIRCPSCGAERRVPRLGELRRLGGAPSGVDPDRGVDRPGQPARSGWSFGHACVMAGCLVGATATFAALLFNARHGPGAVNETAIREQVAATDLGTVLGAWKAFEQIGLQSGPPRVERRFQATLTIARLLWVVAGAGAVVAAGGAAVILTGGSRAQRGD